MNNRLKRDWRTFVYRTIAAEISTLSRYYDFLFQFLPRKEDSGTLLEVVDCETKKAIHSLEDCPDLSGQREQRSVILVNGNFNHEYDIQNTLLELKNRLSRTSRVVVVLYNSYFRWLYLLANRLGIRTGEMPTTFITRADLANIAKISGFAVERIRPSVYFPFLFFGVGSLINAICTTIPFVKWLSLTSVVTLRPIIPEKGKPSISILIPARNEKGNIEDALKRIPQFTNAPVEVVFIEGHSLDGTWEEIQRVAPLYADRFSIKTAQQLGKGKSDAVRLGFSLASSDLLIILDADLTMPPELLGRFYDAYCNGYADFVNGSRLVYPMEGNAMKFLNHMGNVFFAKSLSFMLDTSLGDSLCGTKLLARTDYYRMVKWREDFGDFDPFGDFELLFPAAILALGIVDIPIRYRDRTYGTTQIRRFYHGLMLLRMTLIGLLCVKFGRRPAQ